MFKIKFGRLPKKKRREEILKVLKEHPEGLQLKDVTFWIRAKDRNLVKRTLDELVKDGKVYKRNLGANRMALYYRKIQAKIIIKWENEKKELIDFCNCVRKEWEMVPNSSV